jgi:hypothetical protein
VRLLTKDDIEALWLCERDEWFIDDGILIPKSVNPLKGKALPAWLLICCLLIAFSIYLWATGSTFA